MDNKTKNISERYPIIVLIRLLSTFDYKSGFIRNWDNEKLTIHQIEDILGIRSREMNMVIKKLEPMGIITEYKSNKKRFLIVEDLIIKTIDDSKIIKDYLLQELDKKIKQEKVF